MDLKMKLRIIFAVLVYCIINGFGLFTAIKLEPRNDASGMLAFAMCFVVAVDCLIAILFPSPDY